MQLRWITAAADRLEAIAEYLFEKSPRNAAQLIRKIDSAPSRLRSYPNLGRHGKEEETQEFVRAPWPYIIVYQIVGDAAYIVGLQHGAQDRPR